MARRLPDDPTKRRLQIAKRLFQHLQHFQSLLESGEMDLPGIVTIPETGEEIYLADMMVGIDSLPPRQREAFELICLGGWTETDATKVMLPGSKWSTPCLDGSTKFWTMDGVKTLCEVAGTEQKVLGVNGTWTVADIRSFGHQRLYELVVARGFRQKSIFATAEHRWLHPDLTEMVTTELLSGHHLCTVDGVEWVVDSLSQTSRTEEVFCAVVSDGHAFVLDGDLLTGNCQQYADTALERMLKAYDDYQEFGIKPPPYVDRKKKVKDGATADTGS
jgi:hypothetical protein